MGPNKSANVQEPVVREIQRQEYDLSHFSYMVGCIGSLQTLSVVPVNAGDSMAVDLNGVFRLSPMRRELYLDCVLDLFAFYIPHRHIYASNSAGSRWEDFIKAGYDESVTLGTDTLQAGIGLGCIGPWTGIAKTLPRWWTRGYIQIWNRYFRDPSDVAGILGEDYWATVSSTTDKTVHVGLACCHLKRIWNTAVLSTLTSADYRLALDGGEVDLYNFSQLQGRLKTEQERDWFDLRYSDLLEHAFGVEGGLNIDADQRPELVMRTTQWISGQDVNGTDDATLGQVAGKGVGLGNLSFPPKFFPEHGALWFMALLRFPAINFYERHFLTFKAEPTYQQIAGDPSIISRQGPYALNGNEIFTDSGSVALGSVPYSQWHREHPSLVHQDYNLALGHPFLAAAPISRNTAVYIPMTTYDGVFESIQYRHWNSQVHINIEARRFVPDVNESIFAGTGLPGAS